MYIFGGPKVSLPQTWAGSGARNAVIEVSEEAKTASGTAQKRKGRRELTMK